MVEAVLLDWEGVLADTGDARRAALLRALADEGLRVDETTYAACCEGRAMRSAIAAVLGHLNQPDATLADLVALRASRAFAERLGKGFVLAPGAREFVERVRVGVPVALVTAATRSETEFVLRLSGLEGSIAIIVSADDAADWESGDAHREALARLEMRRPLARERVVALAHGLPALQAARRADVRTVAVGAPAHVALQADGAVDTIDGLALRDVARLAGIGAMEHRA